MPEALDKMASFSAVLTMGFLVLLMASPIPIASAEEVLLAMQEPLAIDDGLTLVIEDVDVPQELIWLSLYDRDGGLTSAVLNLGEHFRYRDLDLAVSKIYAGGGDDLVALQINVPAAVNRSVPPEKYSPSKEAPGKSPGFGAALFALAFLAAALSKAL